MAAASQPARITVLISGSGSNLQALMDATTPSSSSPERIPNARITHVISNRSAAYGLQRAASATPPIKTDVLALKTYTNRHPGSTRDDYDVALASLVTSEQPDLVVLAGFMHILSPAFLNALPADLPIINLHPALPGAFDGAAAIPRALEAFEKGEVDKTGVMVHRVVAEVDRGEPVCVQEVEIKQGDKLEDLEGRIHEVEHVLIVKGARTVLEELAGRKKEQNGGAAALEKSLSGLSLGREVTVPETSAVAKSSASARKEARVTVLISGSGSNLQALMDATTPSSSSPERIPNARITHVISNRSAAYGLQRAASATPPIKTDVLALKTYTNRHPGSTRDDYDVALASLVTSEQPDLVVLAGFMHILSPAFLNALPADLPIINLHPALPGAFDGAAAIPRALEAFEKGEVDKTGVMVHRVVAEVDRGEPVCVQEVAIKKGDKLEDLEGRIHEVEHVLIVKGARTVLEEKGLI